MVNDLTGGTQPQTKTSTAQQEAAGVAGDAASAGQHVAGVAKGQASKVVSEAGSQAKNLFSQVKGEVSSQAGTQQKRVTEGLQSVSKELSSMAEKTEGGGLASDLVSQAASRVGSVADWLDGRDAGSLLDEVKTFARRRPGVFIAVAAGAGLLAGRLTKAITSDSPSDNSPSGGSSYPNTTSYPSTGSGYAAGLGSTSGAAGYTAAGGTVPAAVGEPLDDGIVYDDSSYVEFEPGVDPVTGLRNQGGDRL
ncbi:hypothetical protein [Planctomonas psychrotolerans]|uniref:hypothetical protein n=1 Tax=Planctomonas psychrotolerans TaxID=2528712 RepID=UPI0012393CBC|nr:hypothetical protein [Planctomonas psychrotolerans]